MKFSWPTPSTDTPLVSYPLQHFKQLVNELVVKGVGVVDQALREAFQILKRVLHLGEPRERGGVGYRLRWGEGSSRCSYGASPPLHSSKRPGKGASATRPSCCSPTGLWRTTSQCLRSTTSWTARLLPGGGQGVKGGGAKGSGLLPPWWDGPEKPGLP